MGSGYGSNISETRVANSRHIERILHTKKLIIGTASLIKYCQNDECYYDEHSLLQAKRF
jgi:hypothetical protein